MPAGGSRHVARPRTVLAGVGRERSRAATVSRSRGGRSRGGRSAGGVGLSPGRRHVAVDRVAPRDAEAILSGEEWNALAPFADVRPALAWALKEAAAKAVGDPLGCFLHGLRIAVDARGLSLTAIEFGALECAAGWGRFDGFLYAWVRGMSR